MPQPNAQWNNLIFQRNTDVNPKPFKLSIKLTNAYWAVDGARNIGEIATEDMYDIDELISSIQELISMNLIAGIQQDQNYVSSDKFDMLSTLLSDHLGPMGDIVLEDTIRGLGHEKVNFPNDKIPRLIELLSQEIGDPSKAKRFRETILAKLQQV